MKLHSRHLLTWGFVGAIFLANSAIASAQEKTNYVGLGATDEGFAVNAKIELAEQLSIRPAILTDIEFEDDTDVTVIAPVTYDFKSPFSNGKLLPFVGAGIGGSSRDDGSVGLTVIGGADYRASDKLTANSSIIWRAFEQEQDDEVDFIVGLGYNF